MASSSARSTADTCDVATVVGDAHNGNLLQPYDSLPSSRKGKGTDVSAARLPSIPGGDLPFVDTSAFLGQKR